MYVLKNPSGNAIVKTASATKKEHLLAMGYTEVKAAPKKVTKAKKTATSKNDEE